MIKRDNDKQAVKQYHFDIAYIIIQKSRKMIKMSMVSTLQFLELAVNRCERGDWWEYFGRGTLKNTSTSTTHHACSQRTNDDGGWPELPFQKRSGIFDS